MNKDEFYSMLNKGDLEVTFTKKSDGSTRVMKCTANAPEKTTDEFAPKRTSFPENLVVVYDTERKGWRSFYSDNIIKVEYTNTNFGLLQE